MTTSDLQYPVVMYGKHGLLSRYISPQEMICPKYRLKLFDKAAWWRIVDDDFTEYRLRNYRAVRGAGSFYGFYFQGPFFLGRRVVFEADVEIIGRLEASQVWAVYSGFIAESQDASERDIERFRDLILSNPRLQSISAIDQIYRDFKWGEDTDEDEPA